MQARLAFVSALLGAALAAGCARNVEVADASFGGSSREGFAVVAAGVGPAGAAASPDRFLSLAGKKPGGLGFVQNTPDTWGPFDVSVRTGFFDLSQLESPLGVRVCLEIDTVAFTMFYDVCALFGQTGWVVTAFTHLGNLAGNATIDSNEIELRVEQTGSDVNFYARAAGAMAWTPIATTAFPAQAAPLKAAVGATGLSKGTAVGFDDLVYVSSGPPSAPAPAVAVAADANAALLAGYAAYRDLEGGAPDFVSAAANLGDAADEIDDAQAGAGALPPSKDVSSAAKFLGKADKGLAKAQDQVADESAEKALKTLEKAADALIEAALLLNPQPLPGP